MMSSSGADASRPVSIRLTARRRIGPALVGCTGAKIDPSTGEPHAALDIADPGAEPVTVEVFLGDEIPVSGGSLVVTAIHPWNPPHAAGVELKWWPPEHPAG